MTDSDFKQLMSLQKHFENDNIELPKAGELGRSLSVLSRTTSDKFILDIDRRSTITLTRKKIQERHINTQELLVRIEINGRPHTNPDGRVLSGNHIHIFKEGYNLSYAYELSEIGSGLFMNPDNFSVLFYDFCRYCGIDIKDINIQDVM